MNARGQRLLSLLLLVAMAGLGYLLYDDIDQITRQKAPALTSRLPATAPQPEAATAPDPEHTPPPINDFLEMVARPLFSQERRPPPAAPAEPAATNPVNPTTPVQSGGQQFLVMGIIITDQEKVALLKPRRGKAEVFRVKEGEIVTGWRVTKITPEAVTITKGQRSDRLKLSDNVLSAAEKRRLAQQARLAASRKKRAASRLISRPAQRRSGDKSGAPAVRGRTPAMGGIKMPAR